MNRSGILAGAALLCCALPGLVADAGQLPGPSNSGDRARSPFDSPPVVQVHIDAGRRFQTIDGFGGYGASDVWWRVGPQVDERFVHLLIDDLGLTMLRDSVPMGFEAENDNDTPYVTDYSHIERYPRISGDEASPEQHFRYLKAMHDAGLKRLIATVWSPPPWMKYNHSLGNGTQRQNSAPPYTHTPGPDTNQLRTDDYEEFAEFCVAYIRLLKQKTGIDLYAISLQNEPRFSQFYSSAVYDPDSLVTLIKVVGQRFRQEGISTRIFGPEDVSNFNTIRQYLTAIADDPLASRYVDIFAVHNYKSDGVSASESTPNNWRSTYELAKAAHKSLWMTETSGFDSHSIKGAISLARSLYYALNYGHVSAWLYWQMSTSKGQGLIENGHPTYLYYVSKQFYRHIRPGAVRIEADSSNANLLALAFSGPIGAHTTLILINRSRHSFLVKISGDISVHRATAILTDRATRYRSTALADVEKSGVLCPGQSIMTLLIQ